MIDFFRSAGVPNDITGPWLAQVKQDRNNVRKTEITRDILCKANEQGDRGLTIRREIVKRVVEWEDFSTCYPDKQLAAQGLVANIRRLVNIKDSFTQMNMARERERAAQQQAYQSDLIRKQLEQDAKSAIKRDLYALFGSTHAQQRGKSLEGVLNRFFRTSGLLLKEAFTLAGAGGQGTVEQIDGAIQFKGEIYLVEMKWWNVPIGPAEVNSHLSRLMTRAEARGMFISASGSRRPRLRAFALF